MDEVRAFQEVCLINSFNEIEIFQKYISQLKQILPAKFMCLIPVDFKHPETSLNHIIFDSESKLNHGDPALIAKLRTPFFDILKTGKFTTIEKFVPEMPYLTLFAIKIIGKIKVVVGIGSEVYISTELITRLSPLTGSLSIYLNQPNRHKYQAQRIKGLEEENLQREIEENIILKEQVKFMQKHIKLLKKNAPPEDVFIDLRSGKIKISNQCCQLNAISHDINDLKQGIHPEDLEMLKVKNFEVSQQFKIRIRLQGQNERVFEVICNPELDRQGNLIGVAGNILDITEEYYVLKRQKLKSRSLLHISQNKALYNGDFIEFLEVVLREIQHSFDVPIVSYWEYDEINQELLALRYNKGGQDLYCRGKKIVLKQHQKLWNIISGQRFAEVDNSLSPFKEPLDVLTCQVVNNDQIKGFIFIESNHITSEQFDIKFLRVITDQMLFAYTAQLKNKIKKQLQNSHQKYRYLFENNPLPMWVYDLKTLSILAVNNAALNEYGYNRDEFLEKSLLDFYPESIHRKLKERLKNSNHGFINEGEWKHIKSDGSIIEVETDSHFIEFEERAARIVLNKNVTPRKEAEKNLIKSLNDLKNFQNALNHSAQISFTNLAGEIIEVNDTFCKCSGYQRHELIGQNHRLLSSGFHSTDFFERMYSEIRRGNYWRAEIKNKARDGSFYWVDTTVTPVFDESGKIYRYMSLRYLITDRKKIEEEKERLIKDLSNYAFIASHKIRGPLARILGLIQIFNYLDPADSENSDIIKKLMTSAEELDDVIKKMNQNLDYKRSLSSFL